MSAIMPLVNIKSEQSLSRHFMPHQVNWILAEDDLHAQNRQAFILAEKSIRIGWTYADAFKNVRKRLRFKKRDYLFATKDYVSALEYIRQCYNFIEVFNLTRAVASHGEEYLKVPRLDDDGKPTGFTQEIKVGYVKFTNRSRIIAFSANPQAMAVYGGDVGLDEFAKHPNAQLLWETAQGRVTWGYDLAVWSAHDGQDTLFYQFAQEARAASSSSSRSIASRTTQRLPSIASSEGGSASVSSPENHDQTDSGTLNSQLSTLNCSWNVYYRVTMADAIELGLLDFINQTRLTKFTPEEFLADCRARARLEEVFQQAYMCNPVPAGAQFIGWAAIERCRSNYTIERVHLEADDIRHRFGEFRPCGQNERKSEIELFLREQFPSLFSDSPASGHSALRTPHSAFRLGFDVAASGEGDLAVIYIDQVKGAELWLRALLTCRTDDWHFLKTVLFFFLRHLPRVQAAGDESGLGRQICWEAASLFRSRFQPVNFAARKHDLGFRLMNQLAAAEKRFPQNHPDIASDYFALRKAHRGAKWVFHEGHNPLNPNSHCDIAWAGALASEAHAHRRRSAGALVA